ncbi:MAG: hypothetical protein FWF71_04030 [Actinomycetia bacterium]|nr:hypothetical protein [Actinomycetes bacterium]
MMRIILLSGFLGSGKTTLLAQLAGYLGQTTVTDDPSGQRSARVALIENEVGSKSLSSELPRCEGITSKEMLSSCITCALRDNLALAITHSAKTESPDWLLIETPELASAKEVAADIRSTVDRKLFSSISSIVVQDASRLAMFMEKSERLVGRQLEQVDVLILNKVDKVSQAELAGCLAILEKIRPDTTPIALSAESGVSGDTWQQVVSVLP